MKVRERKRSSTATAKLRFPTCARLEKKKYFPTYFASKFLERAKRGKFATGEAKKGRETRDGSIRAGEEEESMGPRMRRKNKTQREKG